MCKFRIWSELWKKSWLLMINKFTFFGFFHPSIMVCIEWIEVASSLLPSQLQWQCRSPPFFVPTILFGGDVTICQDAQVARSIDGSNERKKKKEKKKEGKPIFNEIEQVVDKKKNYKILLYCWFSWNLYNGSLTHPISACIYHSAYHFQRNYNQTRL